MLPQPLRPVDETDAGDARIPALDVLDRRADAIRALRHAGALFVQGLILVALLSLFFLRVPQVDGHSMAPQIDAGDHVIINTVSYDLRVARPGGGEPLLDVPLRPARRGDVVAFVHGDGDDRRIYLKRVVALPGETIAIERGVVRANGAVLVEPDGVVRDTTDMRPLIVPPNALFVLGDNRGESDDSRSFGAIAESAVVGRASAVVWPLNRVRAIR